MSRLLMAVPSLITVLLFGNGAQAATYGYSFQENILAFPFYPTDRSQNTTEALSVPYANMDIADVAGGVDMNIRINRSLTGWLDSISFNYISQLGLSGAIKGNNPTAGRPYYYSDPDGVNGFGTSYSFPQWEPSSTFLTFVYGNPFGESLAIHFRNLPNGVDAASFAPQYLSVRDAYGWGKGSSNTAYVLANPIAAVPEPTSAMLVSLGLLAVVLTARNRGIVSATRQKFSVGTQPQFPSC